MLAILEAEQPEHGARAGRTQMGRNKGGRARGAVGVLAGLLAVAGIGAPGVAGADSDQPPPPLPVFTPGPTDWKPNFDIWPYSTFVDKVTPEMISGMSDSCQWFNAQFDPLMGQVHDFQDRKSVVQGS